MRVWLLIEEEDCEIESQALGRVAARLHTVALEGGLVGLRDWVEQSAEAADERRWQDGVDSMGEDA